MTRVVLDTGVVVEYIDLKGALHEQAWIVMESVKAGRLEAVIPHPVLSETFYVAARIYSKLGARDPEERALKLIEWLYRLPTVSIVGETLDLALEAGRAKLKYGLALTDCYVLASSKLYNARALFRKREREMGAGKVLRSLTRDYEIVFLEDYA
ncbi:MAG: PIN domain-containing protein [Desulfurococcales archaeon]|nr:PIN domain-containing protein [Desulfurococcales archaeon]